MQARSDDKQIEIWGWEFYYSKKQGSDQLHLSETSAKQLAPASLNELTLAGSLALQGQRNATRHIGVLIGRRIGKGSWKHFTPQ